MEKLVAQCNGANNFPLNVVDSTLLAHNYNSQFMRLNDQHQRLFCAESKACLDFLEYGEQQPDWWQPSKRTISDLRTHLYPLNEDKVADPLCRFVFVHAPSSRDKLNTTREMLMLLLTYHQVMPEFVDFLFPFGKQSRAKDFHFTAFRQRTRLREIVQGLRISELGWSGRDIQICYNLKSVEPSPSQTDRPWSIRHCAINHSFDVENGRITWIMIKGNKLMQQRLVQATSHGGSAELRDFTTIDRAFATTLVVHHILCGWLTENWRWYVNYLEDKFEDISRRTIANEINVPPGSPSKSTIQGSKIQRVQTDKSEKSVFPKFFRSRTPTMETLASVREKAEVCVGNLLTHKDTGLSQPLPPGVELEGKKLPENDSIQYDEYGQQDFSFRDLQDLHFIDIQAGEGALVIKHVTSVLHQLIEYYQYLFKLKNFPQEIVTGCAEEMSRFEMDIKAVGMELQMQASRIEALQRSTSDCMSLLHSILDFRNTQSNKMLAFESRASTQKMEHMTDEMKDIAHKTQTETVSMKIITLVTLFFLPGTFISTLMSTNIFQNKDIPNPGPNPSTNLSPLQLYLVASIPLTFITLMIWAAFHWWEKRKDNLSKFKSLVERHGLLP